MRDGAGVAIDLRLDHVAGELEVARLARFVGAVVGAAHFDRRAARDPLGDLLEGRGRVAGDKAVVLQADARRPASPWLRRPAPPAAP